MTNKSDEMRLQLPRVVAEIGSAVDVALVSIRAARRLSEHTDGDAGLAWQKGLNDALTILRPVQDANERLKKWIADAADAVGVTDAERAALIGGEEKR